MELSKKKRRVEFPRFGAVRIRTLHSRSNYIKSASSFPNILNKFDLFTDLSCCALVSSLCLCARVCRVNPVL